MSHFNHLGRPGKVGGSLPKNNLQTLFLILKGSSTSGNFGHSGIPGHQGGSAPALIHDSDVTYQKFRDSISRKDINKGEIVAGFYHAPTGKIILPKGSATSHDSLSEKIGRSVVDTNTHISFYFDDISYEVKKVIFNTRQAGFFPGSQSGRHPEKALNNIYKAMDKLVSIGFPKGTRVEIFNPNTNTIITSL